MYQIPPPRRWVVISSKGKIQASTFKEPAVEADDYLWMGEAYTHEAAMRTALKDFYELQTQLKYERSHF